MAVFSANFCRLNPLRECWRDFDSYSIQQESSMMDSSAAVDYSSYAAFALVHLQPLEGPEVLENSETHSVVSHAILLALWQNRRSCQKYALLTDISYLAF